MSCDGKILVTCYGRWQMKDTNVVIVVPAEINRLVHETYASRSRGGSCLNRFRESSEIISASHENVSSHFFRSTQFELAAHF